MLDGVMVEPYVFKLYVQGTLTWLALSRTDSGQQYVYGIEIGINVPMDGRFPMREM